MAPPNRAAGMFSARDTRSPAALKRRYHELIKLYHPDRHADRPEWANQMVRAVIAAYNTLKGAVRIEKTGAATGDLRTVISGADQDLRRAVLLGWLRRSPRGPRSRDVLSRIAAARDVLAAGAAGGPEAAVAGFYSGLFSAFLDAAAPGGSMPQPYPWRAPHVFRDLRLGNAFLEKGIRDYYTYEERGRLGSLGPVALSYLADASRFYAYVSRRLEPGRIREVVQSRIAIARSFEQRIRRLAPL